MKHERFNELVEQVKQRIDSLEKTKGSDYAGSEDRLANFKEEADDSGVTPFQVWSVYVGKHFNAIQRAIRTNPEDPASAKKGEPLTENIIDVVMYSILLLGLVTEIEDHEKEEKSFNVADQIPKAG